MSSPDVLIRWYESVYHVVFVVFCSSSSSVWSSTLDWLWIDHRRRMQYDPSSQIFQSLPQHRHLALCLLRRSMLNLQSSFLFGLTCLMIPTGISRPTSIHQWLFLVPLNTDVNSHAIENGDLKHQPLPFISMISIAAIFQNETRRRWIIKRGYSSPAKVRWTSTIRIRRSFRNYSTITSTDPSPIDTIHPFRSSPLRSNHVSQSPSMKLRWIKPVWRRKANRSSGWSRTVRRSPNERNMLMNWRNSFPWTSMVAVGRRVRRMNSSDVRLIWANIISICLSKTLAVIRT